MMDAITELLPGSNMQRQSVLFTITPQKTNRTGLENHQRLIQE
jgi:hypothetical protein